MEDQNRTDTFRAGVSHVWIHLINACTACAVHGLLIDCRKFLCRGGLLVYRGDSAAENNACAKKLRGYSTQQSHANPYRYTCLSDEYRYLHNFNTGGSQISRRARSLTPSQPGGEIPPTRHAQGGSPGRENRDQLGRDNVARGLRISGQFFAEWPQFLA